MISFVEGENQPEQDLESSGIAYATSVQVHEPAGVPTTCCDDYAVEAYLFLAVSDARHLPVRFACEPFSI